MFFQNTEDTICAISTPAGAGAIALIRVSGDKALSIVSSLFSKNLLQVASHTAHFGRIKNQIEILDEVVVTVFKGPHSFTGEDLVEISCHGSRYIQTELVNLIISNGARAAGPGEFSLRAFLHKKMDLSQTEAIADLIAANSRAAHKLAMNQMRGGFANELQNVRANLLEFAALIELELDFSQEDVEFADRTQLRQLVANMIERISKLSDSFRIGNVIKNGVPVAIIGAPNAGKSTLLNALLNEDKAIVSEIPGTTRDVIEDVMLINGIEFRFIDTAGIRETSDRIEILGIERSFEQIRKSSIILLLFDITTEKEDKILERIQQFRNQSVSADQALIPVFNKQDESSEENFKKLKDSGVFISAKTKENLNDLKQQILKAAGDFSDTQNSLIVTNARHYELLCKCLISLERIQLGLQDNLPGDLLSQDIRETIHYLGEITGEITGDEILGAIFSSFCIGK